ncbi:DUF4398 domain-containing protein [Xylophilus sp.]|uniref:DUF4398 domain-containing protein n=1 Tax=Xylophilus sp. TaxID=2653893 RepID=UPI0013B69F10|nr:DUF4398 domain-containing protein [Xylophilus sp.]KAF1050232.1 MAG: hypothetical protein GAK38_00258 [Xylophilus sp.]
MNPSTTLRLGVAAAALAALAGCATSRDAPTSQLALARSAVERAAAAPAAVESAPVELQLARDKLLRAEQAAGNRDYDYARRLAAEAEVDAQVTESRGAALRSQEALAKVREGLRALNDEINRNAAAPAAVAVPVPPPPAVVPVRPVP